MRRTIRRLLAAVAIIVALGGAWLHSHHAVRTPRGWIVMPKHYRCWDSSVVDARGWTWSDYAARPRLVEALRANGYDDFLRELRREQRRAGLRARREAVVAHVGRWLTSAKTFAVSAGRRLASFFGADAEASRS